MTSPEQNNATIRQTPNADDRWRALAVSKAGARAESRAIAAQSDASYTIATAAVPSRVSASSWYVDAGTASTEQDFRLFSGMSAHYDSLPRLIRKR